MALAAVVAPPVRRAAAWWLAIGVALVAGVLGAPGALVAAIGVTAVHCVHLRAQGHTLRGLPLQVRAVFLALLVAGTWPAFAFVHVLQCGGILGSVVFDYCLLARLLALAPWNRREPFSWPLVRWTLLTPPGPGSILARRLPAPDR